jgi:hypothetical protein
MTQRSHASPSNLWFKLGLLWMIVVTALAICGAVK